MPTMSAHLAEVRTAERPAGRDSGQDRVFVLPHAVVVLDGASSPDPGPYDGGWYAETLGHQLIEYLSDGNAASLTDLLACAIAQIARTYSLPVGFSPSSTVAILRWAAQHVEGLVLGDSPIVAFWTNGDVDQLRDDRLANVATRQRHAYVQRLRAGGGYDERHHGLVGALQAAQRSWRNHEGGYWIAEAVTEAAHHAETRCWPRAQLDAALVTTDGVSRGVDQYKQPPSWTNGLDIVRRDGPEQLVRTVHHAEETDPQGQRWPRSKRHDDKALALVAFHSDKASPDAQSGGSVGAALVDMDMPGDEP